MGLWLKQDDGSLVPVGGGGGGGGSGDAGPHDHAEYAPVEHDHDEFVHDHDYLPLAGGTLTGNLTINGRILANSGGGATTVAYGFDGDTEGLGMYSQTTNQWLRFAAGGVQRMQINTERVIVNDDLQVDGEIRGTLAFGIADGIDTRDVLERAETATMPVIDDEGVATTDAEVESITVNEVVTALLAKVKQLSARIETLEGA